MPAAFQGTDGGIGSGEGFLCTLLCQSRQAPNQFLTGGIEMITKECTRDTHVYLISMDEGKSIKVGISDSPLTRLSTLQTANPSTLRMVFSFAMPSRKIAAAVERAFHETQREHSMRGEWFNLNPEEALLILCMLIESGLRCFCGNLTREEYSLCIEKCGLNAARRILNV
jgi:hypothetical protein